MKRITEFFRRLAARMHDLQLRRREAYFAAAVDIHDLEWRMRQYERAEQHATFH